MKSVNDKIKDVSNGWGIISGVVENFVETNLIEKTQRDENIKKASLMFEKVLKETPFGKVRHCRQDTPGFRKRVTRSGYRQARGKDDRRIFP